MKRISLMTATTLFAAAVAVIPVWAAQSQRYEPEASSSHITLEGTSSMHNWEENGTVIRGSVVLTETETACLWSETILPHQTISPAVRVEIPVESLTSGKSAMDKNMYRTLKADHYPVILYRLESAEIQSSQPTPRDLPGQEVTINATGIVMVAGKEKKTQIPMRIKRLPENHLEVSGETSLRMSDFDVSPPKFMGGLLRVGDDVRLRWTWKLAPICYAKAVSKRFDSQEPLPINAEELLPLKPTHGIYLVKEGPEKGREVPFSLKQVGNRWILTKEGLTWHELQRDDYGNILILKEADLLENRQVEYNPPILLLPAVVNGNTSLTGKTRVTIKNAQTGRVTYRGECKWQLIFAGIESIETSLGTFTIYHFQVKHQVALPLTHTSLTIDFGYAIGKGMVVTSVEQVTRVFGLFSNRTTWRLEQTRAS